MGHLTDIKERANRFCEINVSQQVANVSRIPVVQKAWAEGQELSIHGWIYDVGDGLLKQLTEVINSGEQIPQHYQIS